MAKLALTEKYLEEIRDVKTFCPIADNVCFAYIGKNLCPERSPFGTVSISKRRTVMVTVDVSGHSCRALAIRDSKQKEQ